MDTFLRPEKFDGNSHSPTATQEWSYWLKPFENFIASFEEVNEQGKLRLLTNFISHSVYLLIADKTTYETAIEVLKATYVKPINEIFARHKLASRKQSPDESIDQYHQALEQLSKTCQFAEVNAETHRKTYVRDSFIRGLSSHQIRLRLLEFNMLTLDEAVEKARALESAKNQSASYASELTLNASFPHDIEDSSEDSANLAAARPSNSTFKNQKCYFCGRQRHKNRRQCPALNDTCERCQKTGHWQVVCKSPKTVNTKAHPSSAALIAASAVLDKATVPVQVNRTSTFALID
nr:uncharacterized protein LOC112211733 [Halyomorpha halys]